MPVAVAGTGFSPTGCVQLLPAFALQVTYIFIIFQCSFHCQFCPCPNASSGFTAKCDM